MANQEYSVVGSSEGDMPFGWRFIKELRIDHIVDQTESDTRIFRETCRRKLKWLR